MDVRTGDTSPTEGKARLRARTSRRLCSQVTTRRDIGDYVGNVHEDLALLRDAATLMTARQRPAGLLLQLTVNPFETAAYRGLGSHLDGPGVPALAAYARVSASTGRGL